MIDNDYREVDTDEKNVSDVEETKEGTPVETGEVVTDDPTEDNEKTDDFDEFCAIAIPMKIWNNNTARNVFFIFFYGLSIVLYLSTVGFKPCFKS